ncbi:glucosamine-6-phosphate deaminase [Labedella gwakjiensis]|uniref:Glucosamine-6-phosphate deaminase n=1 Tax=Labedella gwakjiensis TaxID=390269 RepID=A0A2P8GR63_9MICO|nr:glucosamine-6-phosphate deaminase [Labedella gwakjiensis]PSL36451.1 glucosamine-6-phosphate deaminase [Labedella gwakjiensis]RUQ85624.1 glucosamine-6-phosphate deaminase [Labedella gwakjiensis]
MAEVIIVPDAPTAGSIVADELVRLIRRRPDAVLGLATGSSPLPVYDALRERIEGVDVSRVRGFALDEYVGLDAAHPESYRSVITREVVEPLGLDPRLIRTPDGSLDGIATAGEEYEAAIAEAGGIDAQILGIGTDGHIGFNEPGSSFASRTRVKTLTRQTREDNARFFESIDDVPMHCITQGLGTILRARSLVLLAFGEGKADAVAGAIEGPVSASLPGSAIQLHEHVTVVVDEAAASRLRNADYYRYAWENKPDWQRIWDAT